MKHIIKILVYITWFIPFFDTDLFVYPSLSHSLLWGISSCLLLSIICSYNITNKKCAFFSKYVSVILFYVIYLILHSFFAKTEYYRLYYYLSGFVFFMAIYCSSINRLISFSQVKRLLIIGLCIQLVFVYGQALHFFKSDSSYFSITGCYENPNVAAMYIALITPLILNEICRKRQIAIYLGLLIFSLVALYLLNCRTAWLSIVIPFSIFVLRPLFKSIKTKVIQKILVGACSIFFLLFTIFLYQYKQDSTDGRTLIWKISAKEIIQKPHGNGYGRFASVYNKLQSDYFRNESSSETEKQNARYTAMAYNDYLENGVDGGIGGLLLHILLIVTFVILAYKQHNKITFSIFLMVSVMSCINFVTISILPWMIFLIAAGYTLSAQSLIKTNLFISKMTFLTVILCVLFLGYRQIQFVYGQYYLAKSQANEDNKLEEVSEFIGTSEAYHCNVAQHYISKKDWQNAVIHCNEALLYAYQPFILQMKSLALLQDGKIKEAEETLQVLRYMIPTHIGCRFQLFQLYRLHHIEEKAHEIAHEILSIEPKIASKEAVRIKHATKHYLNNIHHVHKHN